MTDQERSNILKLSYTLKREISKMCVIEDITELDAIYLFARLNLRKLYFTRCRELRSEGNVEDGETLHT